MLMCSCNRTTDTLDIKSVNTSEHENSSYIETVYIEFSLSTTKCDSVPVVNALLSQIDDRFESMVAVNNLPLSEHYNYINSNVYITFGADTIYGKILNKDCILCNSGINTFIVNPISVNDVVARNKIEPQHEKAFLLYLFENCSLNVEYDGIAHWVATPKVKMSFCDEDTEEDTWY